MAKENFFYKDEFSNSVIVKSDKDIKGKIENVKIVEEIKTLYGEIDKKLNKEYFAA